MRITRSATTAVVFAAVLLAGACSSSKSSSASSGTAPTTTSAAAPSTSASTSAPASASDSASTGAPSTASSSSAAPSTASSSGGSDTSVSACQGSNLKVSIVHGTDADPSSDPKASNDAAVVSLTNSGSSTCTVQGHPQVDLVSAAGVHWPLQPQAGSTPKLTLKPGTSALASLSLVPHDPSGGGQAFQVKSAVITPPDAKSATTVAWPWSWALEDQSAATHSGTYMGAVNQTAS